MAVADLYRSTPLGSVVPMTAELMRALVNGDLDVLKDWSLDADRGYGHLNWQITDGAEDSVKHNSNVPVDYDWSR